MRLIQTAVVLVGLFSAVLAQQRPAAPRSPGVFPDGRITFRFLAPNATDILVNGNWENGRNLAMTLDPELWNYTF